MGRVLIVKSLALSKVVHFLIALPSPKKTFVRELRKKFYHFIWNHKPPKIKSSTLELDIKEGGLKMVNLEHFELSLKVKWLKTLLNSNENWTHLPNCYGIGKIPNYGITYLQYLSKKLKNPFWISVVKAISEFQLQFQKQNPVLNFSLQPLWYNPNIPVDIFKKWESKGMRIVQDVLDSNNLIKSKEVLEKDFAFKINFLDYATLVNSIPREYINHPQPSEISFPWCQEFIITILGHTKNNKSINKVFKKGITGVPTAMNSWQHEIQIGERGNQWNDIFRISNLANRDVNMKMFQYKILHRILATNNNLKQYGIVDSDLCDFCGLETESIIHIFCECEVTTPIWHHISNWLERSGIRLGYLTHSQIVFGDKNWDEVVNRIIIVTKRVIFYNKRTRSIPSIIQILGTLKKQFEVEKLIAISNNKLCYFRGFWSPIWRQINR